MLDRFTKKIANTEGVSLWQCKACNLVKKQKSHLIEHIELSHIPGLHFKCPYCSQWMKTRPAVRSHVNMKHKSEHILYKLDCAKLEWLIQQDADSYREEHF